tara:strand:- start:2465 stop:3304 length:840 start_codon:yes stop_codon:yes gene_type:complete
MNLPRVSIGIPVYNGGKFLKRVLTSIIYQSHKNIEIIISNNCSTDNSLEIIKNFKNNDNRIIFHDQKEKLSMMDNFRFVLKKSNSNYFMWAACDDFRSRNFIKKNLEFLEANSEYVASISPTRFKNFDFNPKRMGDYNLDNASTFNRINKAINFPNANARFYSLFRSKNLKSFKYIDNNYLGDDFAYIIHMVMQGKFNRIKEEKLILSKTGISNQKNIYSRYRKNFFDFCFPFYKLTKNSIFLTNKLHLKIIIFLKTILFNYHANILRLKWLILSLVKK